MSFVHVHAPQSIPLPSDPCLVIESDRLLAGPDVSSGVVLPDYALVAAWLGATPAPIHAGLLEGRACWVFAVDDPTRAAPDGCAWHETRSLLGGLEAGQAQAVSCARQLIWWDRRHRFCGSCGTPTTVSLTERARVCPQCHATFFPVASAAVIVAVLRDDQILLAHNGNFRAGMFSLLAGFVDPGETLEQAVVREVGEEVGVAVDSLRYVSSQPWSFPNSLMIGFVARHAGGEINVDGKEIQQAGWYRRDALPDIPRVGTVARQIIDRWRRGELTAT